MKELNLMKLKFQLIFLFLLDYNYELVLAKESCSFPGAPAHSIITFSNKSLSSGTVASYACERGFELLGPIRRVCNDGSWTPEGIPFCVLNVAAGKAPMQISTDGTGIPQKAIDGSTSAFFSTDTCSESKVEKYPWWYVNLLEPYMIQLVRLDFGKSCCGETPATVVVRVGNNRPDLGTNPICNRFVGILEEGQPLFLPCNPPMPGAFVSVHLESAEPTSLSICEAFVYTDQALPIERCPSFRDQPPGASASYNGKCYTFYDRHQLNFNDALSFCKSRGGTLINESNPALQGFISWELWRRHRNDASSQYWMGAIRDQTDKSAWKWMDGGDVTVSFWNYPGGVENCARYDGSRGWLWTDTKCNSELNFICQHQPRTCGRPEQPPNSTIISPNGYDIGAAIDYTCDKGHLMIGPSVRTCLKTGFYNEFPPVCKFIDCGLPASILHGNYVLINKTTSYLSTVKYGCNKGYEMVGRAILNCDIDERWNGPPPRCEVVECDALPSSHEDATIKTLNGTVFGSIAEVSCPKGYILEGSQVLRCLSTGQWSDSLPKCTMITTTTSAATIYRTKLNRNEIKPNSKKPESTTKPEDLDDELQYLVPGTVREEFPSEKNIIETKNVAPPTKRITETTRLPPTTIITRPPLFETTSSNKNILNAYPQDNEISDNVNIKQNQLPNVDENIFSENGHGGGGGHQFEPETAKLNLSSIIALGAFGGFVFLAAVITSIVVLIKRNRTSPHYRHRASPDCNTVASFDSSTTGSRNGLNRYYRQAWENLHESTSKNSAHNPLRRKDGFEQPKRTHDHFHSQTNSNLERCNRDYVCDSLGLRDGSEMVISDVCMKGENKKRHHHHHHKSSRDQSRRY